MISIQELTSFFRNKRILITGHTGFKGSWLTALLEKFGAEILGFSLPPENPSHFLSLDLRCLSQYGTIANANLIEDIFLNFKPDLVFHLAAQPLVRDSYTNPILTYDINLLGSLKVYLAALKCQTVKSVVSITTDKVYLNLETTRPYRESDRLGGYDPYSSSKACAEIMSDSFRSSYLAESSMKLVTARAGNIVGGGDWAKDRIIPDLIRAALQSKKSLIRAPQSIRPWQHVLEPLMGYLLIAYHSFNNQLKSTSFNLGPDPKENFTVEDICAQMHRFWGDIEYEIDAQKTALHEAQRLTLDSELAKKELGWHPHLTFEQTCEWTADWYREFSRGKILTSRQIEKYLSLFTQ